MPYSLDDAHEALNYIRWQVGRALTASYPPTAHAFLAAGEALDAIEADLPEPCPECGDDHPCAHRTLLSW